MYDAENDRADQLSTYFSTVGLVVILKMSAVVKSLFCYSYFSADEGS